MRLTKSLLSVISALALATGAAFAGGGSQWHSMGPETDEALSLEQFSEPMSDRETLGYDERDRMSEPERLALSEPGGIDEGDSMFTPSADNETPLG